MATVLIDGEIRTDIPTLSAEFKKLSGGDQLKALTSAMNRTGDMVFTKVVRSLEAQTGAQQKRIRAALKKKRANPTGLKFEIVAKDKFLSLKDFNPVKTKGGISAAPWKTRRVFRGTFLGPGQHVFRRTGENKIKKLWGPAIPREMLRGETGKTARKIVAEVFPQRIQHEMNFRLAKMNGTIQGSALTKVR